jgi:arylformamidase
VPGPQYLMRNSSLTPTGWIDVSMSIQPGMVQWPGDPAVQLRQVSSMDAGDDCNLTHLDLSAHTGTHMDAPRHFTRHGVSMSAWSPDDTVGFCRVIAIEDDEAIRAAELAPHAPQPGERILFKTRNSLRRSAVFDEGFIYIAHDAAQLLAAAGVRTVGIDYLSIGGFHKDLIETHVAILGAGIWVIEGLDLSAVQPGAYELNCLPLKLEGADGAPVRALLRRI